MLQALSPYWVHISLITPMLSCFSYGFPCCKLSVNVLYHFLLSFCLFSIFFLMAYKIKKKTISFLTFLQLISRPDFSRLEIFFKMWGWKKDDTKSLKSYFCFNRKPASQTKQLCVSLSLRKSDTVFLLHLIKSHDPGAGDTSSLLNLIFQTEKLRQDQVSRVTWWRDWQREHTKKANRLIIFLN